MSQVLVNNRVKTEPIRSTTIKLIRQPEGSSLCGQTCVAMLLGTTVEEAVELVGHSRGTHGTDLRRGLEKRGKTLTRHKRIPENPRDMPGIAIVRLRFEGRTGSHFVLWFHGNIFDPDSGVYGVGFWDGFRTKGDVYASSYWEVKECSKT